MPPSDVLPNPWLMGVIGLCAAVVLWWLTPDMARHDEETGDDLGSRRSGHSRWPRAIEKYRLASGYLSAVLCAAFGVMILVGAATGRI
jgi:hypothetical protein